MDQKTEIHSYIKCCVKLNIDSKQIFNELCGIYGPQTISVRTVFRWVKAFKAGKFSVEDDTRPGRPKTSVTKANIAAVKILLAALFISVSNRYQKKTIHLLFATR